MNELIKIDIFISILTEKCFLNQINWNIRLKLIGDKRESIEFFLNSQKFVNLKKVCAASTSGHAYLQNFHINISDVGKIKKIIWSESNNLDEDEIHLYEIQLRIPYRNEILTFPIDQLVNNSTKLILEPNLKPGEKGAQYVITTHTGAKQNSKSQLDIVVQIIGEKAKTKFIPLQHSQLNKQAFIAGRRDIFDIHASDVGRITKVIIGNHSESEDSTPIHNWYIDNLEVKTLSNSHNYNFAVNRYLLESEEIILVPMNSTEIVYFVVLRYNDIDISHSNKLTDVYFIIYGEKGSTKKIYINNYELPKAAEHGKEKIFEFKSEDVGKVKKINVSLNEDNNQNNCIYIDYIEIKIPSRSEAYKFPVERALGAYLEDGKCELDLEVWKHPERRIHIDYEVISETGAQNDKEAKGRVYLIIHGSNGKTGKIELNDGNFENSSLDNYEFKAPDVGKIAKIELFYSPVNTNSAWQLESLEVKVPLRNEAYKFPVLCWLNEVTNYLELLPWKKPNVTAH